jgi:hypothetical protein
VVTLDRLVPLKHQQKLQVNEFNRRALLGWYTIIDQRELVTFLRLRSPEWRHFPNGYVPPSLFRRNDRFEEKGISGSVVPGVRRKSVGMSRTLFSSSEAIGSILDFVIRFIITLVSG